MRASSSRSFIAPSDQSGQFTMPTLSVGTNDFKIGWFTALPMIPGPYEPFDSNRKDDKIFLLGSMFIVIFLFLL